MHLPGWIQSKRPRRKGSSTEQHQEDDDPPPYPDSQVALDAYTVEGIKAFRCSLRGTPHRDWRLKMLMLPTTDYLIENASGTRAWMAQISITTDDLPHLMRSGLHVTENNVRKTKGHFLPHRRLHTQDQQMLHMRMYYLTSVGSRPRWQATLAVASSTVGELSRFRVNDVSAANVAAAIGLDKSGNRVYNFSTVDPEDNFNAVYDDLPLGGWWPWPRSPPKSSKKGLAAEVLRRIQKWKAR